MPRKEGMERKDLLKANVAIFKSQGAALDKYAKKTVKVIRSIFSDVKHSLPVKWANLKESAQPLQNRNAS